MIRLVLISMSSLLIFGCFHGKAPISGKEDGIVGVKVSLSAGKEKSDKPLTYNEKILTEQLKGKSREEVIKVLGNPTR